MHQSYVMLVEMCSTFILEQLYNNEKPMFRRQFNKEEWPICTPDFVHYV